MARVVKERASTEHYIDKYVCDKCEKVFDREDIMDVQEMVHVGFSAGYSSVFGDGNVVELDLCQHCFKELAGEYVKIK